MNKARKQIIAKNEISEICETRLGGYSQKIMLDGKRKSNPIAIFLHGGPGSPIPFSVGCRGMFPEITDKITLVCWDQLGCGINNYPIDDSFSIDSFVEMTVDLIKEIRNRFADNRIILFGVSWGSILALRAANRALSMLDGVVTYGQVLCNMTFNDEVYNALEKGLPQKKREVLDRIIKERNIQNAKTIMSWIRKYTNGYSGTVKEKAPIMKVVSDMLKGPDYKFQDVKAMIINGYSKNSSLIQELVDIDLRKELSAVKLPYTIIQGSCDIVTSTKEIEEYISATDNKNIKFFKLEGSGHIPGSGALNTILDKMTAMANGTAI